MKTVLLLLFSASFASAALVASMSSGITSTVTLDGSVYQYRYTMASKPFGKHELSHVSIDLCDSKLVFDDFANVEYEPEFKSNSFKWDDIEPKGKWFVFGFYSMNAPGISYATAKASRQTESFPVYAPVCAVPEPKMSLVGLFALVLLTHRERFRRK